MADAVDLAGWTHAYSGKVRDLYVPAEDPSGAAIVERYGDVVLVVASDRISAYDHVLSPGIPGKGVVLTQAQPVVVRAGSPRSCRTTSCRPTSRRRWRAGR